MDLTEKKLTREDIYKGRIITLHRDTVALPNGKTALREIVDHPGGVGILALDDRGRAALVQQYRYAFGRAMWEIPAGKREPGEEPFVTAQRELEEEVGARAEKWTALGDMIPSPGCYGETLWLYLAQGLTLGRTHPDEDEFLQVKWMPFSELVEKCLSGELRDAKTVCAALKVKLLLG